jgi:hypothetical protein
MQQQRRSCVPTPAPQDPGAEAPQHSDGRRTWLDSIGSVTFFVDAGSHLQRCLIERATLLLYFGARDNPLDVALDSLHAFDRFCPLISAVARDLVRHGGGAMCEALMVSADAVFGHLTRGARARIRQQSPALALAAG